METGDGWRPDLVWSPSRGDQFWSPRDGDRLVSFAGHPLLSDEGDPMLFEISTTVDPSYIISLIRKLVPTDFKNGGNGLYGYDAPSEELKTDNIEKSAASLSEDRVLGAVACDSEAMDIVKDFDKSSSCQGGEDDESCRKLEKPGVSAGEEAWEESRCILWDLAANRDHAEFMVANACITAGVVIANVLSDAADLASEISQDLPFLQGPFDIFPYASDDLEARSALWNIIARLLVQVGEEEMSPSGLDQFVSVLVSKMDMIEDDLLDYQLDDSSQQDKSLTPSRTNLDARTTAVSYSACWSNFQIIIQTWL